MQQTTKYQFKLIEGSDDFSPQPLNDNVEKVEEALSDMEDAIDGVMEAAYTPDNKPFVVGSYSGGGLNSKMITLGFRPSLVIISGDKYTDDPTEAAQYFTVANSNRPGLVVELEDTGFSVATYSGYLPVLNESGRSYRYIAFR